MCITHSQCMSVTLVTQHAMCMRHIILRSVASLVLSTLSHKWYNFCKEFMHHTMRVLIVCIAFV